MTKKDVSNYQVDENVIRLIALQVMILALLVYFFNARFLAVLLVIDFALRAFTYLPTPLALLAKILTKVLKLPLKPIFARPKKFAASIGFVFSVTISILLFLNFNSAAFIVIAILVIFSFLEAVFKICAGCYVYNSLFATSVKTGNPKNK